MKRFGMSDQVGLRVVAGSDGMTPPHSERLAAAIDDEIRGLLDRAYGRAGGLLRAHGAGLEQMAQELLERETLTGPDLATLLDRCVPRLRTARAG